MKPSSFGLNVLAFDPDDDGQFGLPVVPGPGGELITIGSRGPITEVVGALRKKNGRQPASGISAPISRMCLR